MIAAFFGGVALVLAVWLVFTHRDWADASAAFLERERQLSLELRDAQNRLYAAWQAGAQIPPSDIPVFVDPRKEAILDPILVEFLDAYEGDARAKYERMIRARIGKLTPLQILKEFEGPHPPQDGE